MAKISKQQLDKGAKIELEHANTIKKHLKKGVSVKTVARSIARDHLKECKDYYKFLPAMEKKCESKNKRNK